jgi:predicted nucleic acid-binding protein
VTGLVLDCSVAVTWCFEDETTPETDALLERVKNEGAMVPMLWQLEMGNVLLQAERRGRITRADVARRLELIGTLPITTDDETSFRALRDVLALARTENLTTYDAAYLELAMRRGLPARDN